VLNYLAGPTAYGENMYAGYTSTGEYPRYIGYDDPSGLKMMINEAPDWSTGEPAVNFWNGGIAISQWNDMETEGYTNQLSVFAKDAITGFGGYNGSKTFAVANNNSAISFYDNATECTFDHFWVANNTYTALSMTNGDDFAKKFGTGDWFKVIINAFDKNDNPTGKTVEFYLADFRTATSPGIINKWCMVDLTPLGNNVHAVKFTFDSTDTGDWGMNTPAYFCFDNLAIKK
jgi:hypothetical protein